MKKATILLLASAILLFAVSYTHADEMEGDRPDFTDSAATVTQRSVQLEGGYTFSWDPDVSEHSLGELLIRWGLLDWMELRFGLNSFIWTVENYETFYGKDDMSFGTKIRFFHADEAHPFFIPDLAIEIYGLFPTGSGRYREPLVRFGGNLCADWSLSGSLTLGVNAGYLYDSVDRERFHRASFSSSLGWALSEKIGFFVEYYGLYPESAGEDNAHYADLGFILKILENFHLDIRGGVRLDRREYFTGAGFVGRWMY